MRTNAAQAIIEQFIYTKMSPHLKKNIKQAKSEIGTYEQIVSHFEKEFEVSGSETPDGLKINTVTQHPTKPNLRNPNRHHCKIKATAEVSVVKSEKRKTELKASKMKQATIVIKTVVKQTLTLTTAKVLKIQQKNPKNRIDKKRELSTHLVKILPKLTTPEKKAILKPTQQKYRLVGIKNRWDRTRIIDRTHNTTETKMSTLKLKPHTRNGKSSLWNCSYYSGDHQKPDKISNNSWGYLAATPGDNCQPPQARQYYYWLCNSNYPKDPWNWKHVALWRSKSNVINEGAPASKNWNRSGGFLGNSGRKRTVLQ